MSISDILQQANHRPWKIPAETWKFYQEWNNALFLHWEVELETLEYYVPKELEIDLFEGKPWISLVAFSMEKIRPKNLTSFAPVSDFDEINIRTYVRYKGKTGVYFLSIEGGKRISCKLAKAISELPYRFSEMKRTENSYESSNNEFDDKLKIEYVIGETESSKSALDKWLTERYALFQDTPDALNEFEIHHLEWPIKKLEIKRLELNYKRFSNLFRGDPDKVHYSSGVQVVAWGKQKKEAAFSDSFPN